MATRWLAGAAAAFLVTLAMVGCKPAGNPGSDMGTITIDAGGPVCGNGMTEPPEDCDPPNGTTCDSTCQFVVPECGNSVVETGEDCDPPDAMTCDVDCTFLGPSCGDNVVDPPEQCDPPDGVNCSPTCQLLTPGTVPVGGPCTFDAECMTSAGMTAGCLAEADSGWPGGYCLLLGCTVDAMTGTDNCPLGAICQTFGDGMGGTNTYCMAGCTPNPAGIASCRTAIAGSFAYGCVPDLVDPIEGYCGRGCEDDGGCNTCDTGAGTCFNDPTFPCVMDSDCLMAPLVRSCNTTINQCYPNHPAGAVGIGGPCTGDGECPANAFCFGADGTSATWPGGYCSVSYCDSYGSFPEFSCPAGSNCPSQNGFFGGLLQLCAASCAIDTASPDGQCDGDRGDNFDYVCIENATPTVSLTELFDTQGAPGFCFQCEGLFGAGTPECP